MKVSSILDLQLEVIIFYQKHRFKRNKFLYRVLHFILVVICVNRQNALIMNVTEENRRKACKLSIQGIKGLLQNSLNCLVDQINNHIDIVTYNYTVINFTYMLQTKAKQLRKALKRNYITVLRLSKYTFLSPLQNEQEIHSGNLNSSFSVTIQRVGNMKLDGIMITKLM